jgi:hypothetical protein
MVFWSCAQAGAAPGWGVRVLDTGNTIDSHSKAEEALDMGTVDGLPVIYQSDATGIYTDVNLQGGPGTFSRGYAYPNGVNNESMEDFAVRAIADVIIPAGTWTIGFGTDDGGQITIPGVSFDDSLNNDSSADDQIRFEGNRGHDWTVGSFTLNQPLNTTITASMHERGGGDTFEIAVINMKEIAAANRRTWQILADGTFGWSVKTDAIAALHVGGKDVMNPQTLAGSVQNQVFGPPGAVTPGLTQEWVAAGNPGSKRGIDRAFERNAPMVPPFKAGHGSTWWTGNQTPIEGLVQYPDEVQPPLNDSNNENYVVRAKGQILLEESGTYQFTDGIDDYTYWAIDVNRDGQFMGNEVLIDDNNWTSLDRTQSNGAPIVSLDVTVPQGGSWFDVEFLMGEGTGTDAGIIYWDYDAADADGDGRKLGDVSGFPTFDTEPIDLFSDGPNMYIPDTHLRSTEPPPLVSADVVASLATDKPYEFDINGNTDTADKLVVQNQDPAVYTTKLDVTGATFRLIGTGSFQAGDKFDLVDANVITGTPTIVSADPSQSWSFNPATGEVTFGVGARLEAGDADQDLDFDQLDLVRVQVAAKYLSGQAATWGEGDWNGAPGGSPGNPPAGDSRFNQADIIAALNANKYLKGPYAALVPAPATGRGDGQTSIIYNATTGEVAVDAPAGTNLTSVNIDSAARIFTGAPAQNLGGSFDNDADGNIFKATFGSSFGSLSFGNVAQPGLSQPFVLNDLTVVGSLAGGGALGNVDLIYIPEPSTLVLVGLGFLGLAAARIGRRR